MNTSKMNNRCLAIDKARDQHRSAALHFARAFPRRLSKELRFVRGLYQENFRAETGSLTGRHGGENRQARLCWRTIRGCDKD